MATYDDDNPYRSPLAEAARLRRSWSWQRVFRIGMMCLAGYFTLASVFGVTAATIDLIFGMAVTELPLWGDLALAVVATFQVFAYAIAMRCWRPGEIKAASSPRNVS